MEIRKRRTFTENNTQNKNKAEKVKERKSYEENIRIIMLAVYIHHECHGTDMGRDMGHGSSSSREERCAL